MKHLQQAIEEYERQATAIKESGPIAPDGSWIDTYKPGGRETAFARKRSKQAIFNGKKTESLGRKGSKAHKDFEQAIARRKALAEIESRLDMLRGWQADPIWQPPFTVDQPVRVKPSAQTKTPVAKSVVKAKAKSKKKAPPKLKAVLKGAAHATPINRTVHLVLAESEPEMGRWYTKALCGDAPKPGSWGWLTCDLSEVDCARCCRKAKQMGVII